MDPVTRSEPSLLNKPAVRFLGLWAKETGLSVGTGIAADAMHKALMKKGAVPAAVLAVGGAALLKATVKGGLEVASNAWSGHDLGEGVDRAVAEGFRTGLIDATHSLIAPNVVAHFKGKLSPTMARALSGAVLWSVNGAVTAGTAPSTWEKGAQEGLETVGKGAGTGAVTGVITGPLGAP